MMSTKNWSIIFVLCMVRVVGGAEVVSPADFRVGMPLTAALQQLQKHGLETVFSSQVVRPEMKVRRAVSAQQPREMLTQLLAPHGLDVREGPNGVLIIVRGRLQQQEETRTTPVSPTIAEEIIVQPSRISLLVEEPVGSVGLTREEIQTVPHFGDDVFRALSLLPGTTSGDLSSQFNLRGGRRDEMLILLDGQELYDPYHLKDFDNALSIIGASALARVHLITAAFPVSYGDRMSGVLNMVTVTPPAQRRYQIGVSMFGAQVEASDSTRDFSWIGSLRTGSTDLLGPVFELDEARFWDFFGKLDYVLTPRQSVRIHTLGSVDHLDTSGEGEEIAADEQKLLNTEYSSSYLWLTHRGIVSERLFVDTSASVTDVRRDRRGSEDDDERSFDVTDERKLNVAGFLQSWNYAAGPRHFVNAGVDYQKFTAFYDYASHGEFDTPLAAIGSPPQGGSFSFRDHFGSERLSLYASDRMRLLDALTVELGVRYDRQNSVDDNVVSPRLNAAWAVSANSVVRLGWGHFSQSHRPYEMMVEDGDATLYPAERSQHWVLGYERLFGESTLPLSTFRVEAYRRYVSNPRPRYESLFQPFDPFPEGEFDRVRIEAESATAQGIELLLRGRPIGRADWWMNYSLSSTEDRIAGRNVLRGIDQTHALNLDVNYQLTREWNVNIAWVLRSGHPVTPISFDASGNPILGDMNSDRLDPYHRLDLRVGRDWKIKTGTLRFFVDAHNVYNEENISGLDLGIDDETGELVARREHWPGVFASAGITWTFE